MTKTVECFYTLSSPWMYLGGKQLSDSIKRPGHHLVPRPYVSRLGSPDRAGVALRTRPSHRLVLSALEVGLVVVHLAAPRQVPGQRAPTPDSPARA